MEMGSRIDDSAREDELNLGLFRAAQQFIVTVYFSLSGILIAFGMPQGILWNIVLLSPLALLTIWAAHVISTQWHWSVKLTSHANVKDSLFMLRFSLRHYPRWYAEPVLVIVLLALFQSYYGSKAFLYLSSFPTVFVVLLAATQARPPYILILGASRRELITLHDAVLEAYLPWRPVSMLNPLADTNVLFSGLLHDIYRANDDSWRHDVEGLAEICHIIILDARGMTDNVRYELSLLRSKKLERKSKMILVDDPQMIDAFQGTRASTIDELSIALHDAIYVTKSK